MGTFSCWMLESEEEKMLFYSEELKNRLGLMIEYKRNELLKNDKKWCIKRFIESDKLEPICDFKTYQKLSSGTSIKNDDVYDVLIKKLGYSKYEVQVGLELFDQLGTDLVKPIDFMNDEAIANVCQNYVMKLEKCQNGFLVDELIEVTKLIEVCYMQDKFISEDEYRRMEILYSFIGNDMKAVFLDLMYQYVGRYICKLEEINQFMAKYHLEARNEKFLKIYVCEWHMFNEHIELSKHGNTALLKEFKAENNLHRELLMNMSLFNIYDGICNVEYYFYFDEIKRLLSERDTEISSKIKGKLYSYLGMYFYCNDKFQEAFPCLEHCFLINHEKYRMCYVYCAHMNSFEFIREVKFVDEVVKTETNSGLCYEYYRLKVHGASEETLEKYIVNKIRDKTKPKEFMYDIFYKELIFLVNITSHYKYLKEWALPILEK